MSNGDVLLDIQNQEQVPPPTPTNQTPTPTSRDDKILNQDDVTHFLPMGPPLIIADDDSRTSIDQSLISRLKGEIRKIRQHRDSIEQVTKIQRIPQIMTQQKKFGKEYYRPRAMTIGPIFESEIPEECSALKLKLAAEFIAKSGRNDNDLLESIKKKIVYLSSCFDDQVLERFKKYCSLDVTLLLDGCSTLQFIYSRVWDELKELQINNGEASLIEQDLFLMENQIPFGVLKILMDQVHSDTGCLSKIDFQISIDIFIQMNLMTPENFLKGSYLDFYKTIGKEPVHLLDILRSGLLYAFDASIYFRNIQELSSSDRRSGDPSSNNEPKREYFRNIQELKAARIKLESSGISCLRDVTFTSCGWFRARLKLPPLIVNDSTGRKLWNLVAYEMCPENCKSDYGVTSYVRLLDSLIDNEEDVKELRSARILRNHLSSDNEVAKLFNEIGFNTAFDQVYPEVKRKIQKRFNSRWAMLIAQFLQEYFRRPWTFIALLGAIAALALTATQTHFTIHPAK